MVGHIHSARQLIPRE